MMLGLVSVDFGFISTSFLIFSDETPHRTAARQWLPCRRNIYFGQPVHLRDAVRVSVKVASTTFHASSSRCRYSMFRSQVRAKTNVVSEPGWGSGHRSIGWDRRCLCGTAGAPRLRPDY